MRIGGTYLGNNRCEFVVWAPFAESIQLSAVAPFGRRMPLQRCDQGYWRVVADGLPPGTRYFFRINDTVDRPDPASRFQPDGVHRSSQIVDHSLFLWEDDLWCPPPTSELIIYELHVGTFTPEGSFSAIVQRLEALKETGINAIELMPVAQFPGERNWGYDGAYPFAVQNSYGGPDGLKHLVNECHKAGITVLLDVVYNHFGPEGSYLAEFGPYYTKKYRTPWGDAINFDDAYNDGVRNFFIEHARYFFTTFHVDALRLDAVHSIYDFSARPFLRELNDAVRALSVEKGRSYRLIAESDLNDTRILLPEPLNGYGLDAQWSDDFHHSVHALLTGERQGYYGDFGSLEDLRKALSGAYVYTGQYSGYRHKRFGTGTSSLSADRFVVFSQNHDQVGNRMLGERLSSLLPFESLKLAAGLVLLSPYIPLLFMGEEYGEKAPFLYFVSHTDRGLAAAVSAGRKEEFAEFEWKGEVPDPVSEETFLASRLRWELRDEGEHRSLLAFYHALITLRKTDPALSSLNKETMTVSCSDQWHYLCMERRGAGSRVTALFNFGEGELDPALLLAEGTWEKLIDSADASWCGPGSDVPGALASGESFRMRGKSFIVLRRTGENNG